MAKRAAVLRRAIHVSLALSLLYYLVPDPLPVLGIARAHGALLLAGVVTVAEAWRLKAGGSFSLFRDYEMKRPAAYYWLGLGCCIALVFFPPRFAIVTILGVCLGDPAIGLARATRHKRWAGAVGFVVWVAAAAAACFALTLPVSVGLLVLGATVAVSVEPLRLPFLDDDFTMNLAPLVAMTAAARLLGL